MVPRLTETQLAQAIAEIEKLSQRRESELSPEQVREILQELNLPDELLEDAIAQLQRRKVLEQRQRRNRWIAIATTAVIIAAIAIGVLFWQNWQQQIAQVVAGQDRIALSKTSGDNLSQVSRQTNSRVYYQVTLKNAPIDRQLSLQCDWIDPSGQTVHQGRYQTRTIATPIWNTYCFYNLDSAFPQGNWEVRMSLDGRILSTQPFTVQ
ncbi:DUF3859 domain-containing protein [Kamptonema animale CS-326]|jgi:hypothetical protein|uniref:DUF3859 domain-containing protein n=1 Tax=Kamptonema animale TaxID=92934 RepID=UPI00232C1270|nr:DUF3859 domain-containing protein [Kamptonema animale]MDB9511114.1 DUF3859 domain-containing protein [Kamptonema animale CS-326]